MRLEQIEPIAQSLIEQLSSACVRIEIKGSICRRKPDPHDIDVICIPSIGESVYPIYGLFATSTEIHTVNHLEEAIATLLAGGDGIVRSLPDWEFDPIVKRNGPHLKRLRHIPTQTPAELYITDQRHWGCLATIRTGPGDFCKALVNYAHRQTMFIQAGLLHKHAPMFDEHGDVKPCPAGERCLRIVETPEERDVFNALGLPWIEPARRNGNLFYATVPRGMIR